MSEQPDHRTGPSRPAWWPSGWWPGGRNAAQRTQESERLRSPQPLVRTRLPSGRGAMEQPNITSDGAAILTPRFWAMVAATGIATGLFGDLMMWILFNVQYLAFGYHSGSLQHGIEQASALRRVSSLLIAGAFGGVAWYLLRRHTKGELSELDESIWNGDGQLSFRRRGRSRWLPPVRAAGRVRAWPDPFSPGSC